MKKEQMNKLVKGTVTERLPEDEWYARALIRSRYHDFLFSERNRERPDNQHFDEIWMLCRHYYLNKEKFNEGSKEADRG